MERVKAFFALAWVSLTAHPAVKFIIKWWKKFWELTEQDEFVYTFPLVVFGITWLTLDNPVILGVVVLWGIVFLRKCFEKGK